MDGTQPVNQLTPELRNILIIIGIAVALYWLKYIRLARESVRHTGNNIFYGLMGFGITWYVLQNTQLDQGFKMIISAVVGMVVFSLCPKRSRRIPKGTRRAVIERDVLSKGEKYNPKKVHIDHNVPFSKGGSHTLDNLRVIPKEENLRKGAKNPGFFDIFK